MQYRLRCNECGRTFTASYSTARCTGYECKAWDTSLLENLVGVAVVAGAAYAGIAVTASVFDSVLGGLFD